METIQIDLEKNNYNIYIDKNLLASIDKYLDKSDKYIIVTDENVDSLYGDYLINSLGEREVYKYVITPGEDSKNINTLTSLLSFMLDSHFNRKSIVIAFGGGVVGDLAGFAASIYMRGVKYIQVPTTLLAQVDSSVGGKTAVNFPQSKNSVGSFYQPKAVIIDTQVLISLPYRELLSGIGEVIKYGIIYDYNFFLYIKENIEKLKSKDEDTIKYTIKRCCEVKAQVVANDEKETSIRKILNFGHTIGHSLEGITNYKKYTHGEAIIIGMYYEAKLALKMGLINDEYYLEIASLLENIGLDLDISMYDKDNLINIMTHDKKNTNDKISFILPIDKGKVKEYLLDKNEIFL